VHATDQEHILQQWLERHRGLLFKVVRAYAFDSHDRDDLFQEIVIQVWSSIPRFRGESAETTWIYRIALFCAISWKRSERRHTGKHDPLEDSEHLLIAPAQESDDLDWLYQQIALLDPLDRSLALLLLDGFSYRDMAEILGLTESNVGVRINRIKTALAAQARPGAKTNELR
jgi:RNA polymerase sigma-70 factor (ECF subfamily)